MLGDLGRQLGELGFGFAQRLLRAVEPCARLALAVAGLGFGRGQRLDLGAEVGEDLPRFADQRFLARGVAAELLGAGAQLALALGGTRRLALEVLLLDAQPPEDGGALAFLLAQRVHALGEARLVGERLRFRFGRRRELRQRIAQAGFLAVDVRLRVGPCEVHQERVLAADLVGDFLVAPRRARLPLQAVDLAVELAQHVAEAREIGFRRLQAQLGLVAAAVQPGDAGGVLEDAAALLGLGVDDLADLPLAHQRRRAGAGRRVLEQDLDVARARLAAVDAIGRARLALDAAGDLDLVGVVELGRRAGARCCRGRSSLPRSCAPGGVLVPEKITSSMAAARMLLCEVSPMTQRSASSRLDLPQPFGPTTPVRPGSMTSSVGSTNDLKPNSLRREIFIAVPARSEYGRAREAAAG